MGGRSSTASESFSDVFQKIRSKPALVPLFATMAWSIWYQRNKFRLKDNLLPLHNIVGFAKNYLGKFKSLDRPRPHYCSPILRRWLPPTAGSVKMNYDGAMFRESDNAGIGVVIRDSEGQVLATLSKQLVKPPSMEILELLAARQAVKFTAELGYAQGNVVAHTLAQRARKSLTFQIWLECVPSNIMSFVLGHFPFS